MVWGGVYVRLIPANLQQPEIVERISGEILLTFYTQERGQIKFHPREFHNWDTSRTFSPYLFTVHTQLLSSFGNLVCVQQHFGSCDVYKWYYLSIYVAQCTTLVAVLCSVSVLRSQNYLYNFGSGSSSSPILPLKNGHLVRQHKNCTTKVK